MRESDCCNAPILASDICGECGEHCTVLIECPTCDGTGELFGVDCGRCKGSGVIEEGDDPDSPYIIPEIFKWRK